MRSFNMLSTSQIIVSINRTNRLSEESSCARFV